MSGLFGTLSIALSGLAASQQELETSSNNVANANTPGYSEEVADAEAGPPIVLNSLSVGTGVLIDQIESLRDPILEIQLNQQTQLNSYQNSQLTALQQIQTGFSSSTSGIGADITKFFDSIQQLSPDPTNLSLRQGVLTAAVTLANDFNSASSNLQTQRADLDQNVVEDVGQINTLTSQIASVDRQIGELSDSGQNADPLVDQQTSLIRQLSALTDVQVISNGKDGISLTTSNGTELVSGTQSFALSTQLGSDGVEDVLSGGGQDITSTLTGGSLGGTIEIRDQEIPGILSQLDQLASGFSNAVNAANAQGVDLNGDQGGAIFSTPPAGVTGAAGAISVVMTDPSGIAASSDGTQGSNGNLANLSNVASEKLANGNTPIDAYASLVFQIGNTTSNSSADADASGQILQQLQDERNTVSGVSLNQEAANMVQYQSAYQAAARVVTTINNLLLDAVNLGSATTEE